MISGSPVGESGDGARGPRRRRRVGAHDPLWSTHSRTSRTRP